MAISQGTLGWTSRGELQRDTAANDAKLEARLAAVAYLELRAVGGGSELQSASAIACTSTTAPPVTAPTALGNQAVGAPDLTDADWLYGGDGDTILKQHPRRPQRRDAAAGTARSVTMARMKSPAYVLASAASIAPPDWVAAGKVRFDTLCVACHGADGRGNPALGAPNLSRQRLALWRRLRTASSTPMRDGRSGVMPAWRARLSDDEARLIAAWVIAQGMRAWRAMRT